MAGEIVAKSEELIHNMDDPKAVEKLIRQVNNMDDRVRGDVLSAFQAADVNQARSEINNIEGFAKNYKALSDADREAFKGLIKNQQIYKWLGTGSYWSTEPSQLAGFGIPEFDKYAKSQVSSKGNEIAYRRALTPMNSGDEMESDKEPMEAQERLGEEGEEEREEIENAEEDWGLNDPDVRQIFDRMFALGLTEE